MIFHPALDEHAKTKEIALDATKSITPLTTSSPSSSRSIPVMRRGPRKFTVMKENIEHHIEEEEGEM